jgi:hypothetical protein
LIGGGGLQREVPAKEAEGVISLQLPFLGVLLAILISVNIK